MRNIAVFLFVFLAISADLKVTIFSYIHWLIWLVLILPLMIIDFRKKGFIQSPLLILGVVIFFIGCFTSAIFTSNADTIVQILKFSVIFLTLYYFLYYNEVEWKIIFNAINFAVVVNTILLVMGLVGLSVVSQLMTSDGRWGTILAYPGSLVKIGAYGFYLNVIILLLGKRKFKLFTIVMIFLSLFVIYMDGSRTGMLVILLTIMIIPLLYSIVNYRNKVKSFVLPIIIATFFIVSCIALIPYLLQSRIGESLINLVNSTSLTEGLEKVDPARFMMYQTALEKIYDNPYIGTGSFTTVGVYEDGTSMVVHNVYLQLWGDYGFIGLVGMLCIYLGWLALIPGIMTKLQLNNDYYMNIFVCSSILMLVYFILNGLFHPYSSEFSEWIVFIIPLSVCSQFYRTKIDSVEVK